jgi:hypothetical protein
MFNLRPIGQPVGLLPGSPALVFMDAAYYNPTRSIFGDTPTNGHAAYANKFLSDAIEQDAGDHIRGVCVRQILKQVWQRRQSSGGTA